MPDFGNAPPQNNNMMMIALAGMCCLLIGVVVFFMWSKGMFTPPGATTAPGTAACPDDPSCSNYCDYYPDDTYNCAPYSGTDVPAVVNSTQSKLCTATYNPAWEARQEPPYDASSCPGEVMTKSQTCNQWQSIESPAGSGKYIWALVGRAQGCNTSYNTNAANFQFGGLPQPNGVTEPLPSGNNFKLLNTPTGVPSTVSFAAARRARRLRGSRSGARKTRKVPHRSRARTVRRRSKSPLKRRAVRRR